jgi:hypothetical protein
LTKEKSEDFKSVELKIKELINEFE